jgi:hypothetical protein
VDRRLAAVGDSLVGLVGMPKVAQEETQNCVNNLGFDINA